MTYWDFNQLYPNDAACLDKAMHVCYGSRATCPKCHVPTFYYRSGYGFNYFICGFCLANLYPLKGTPLSHPRPPLRLWFEFAFRNLSTQRNVTVREQLTWFDLSKEQVWRMRVKLKKNKDWFYNIVFKPVSNSKVIIKTPVKRRIKNGYAAAIQVQAPLAAWRPARR